MQVFVQLLITGVAMGFIYALVGIEYTLIWNSTGLLNFSHDKFILFGAYMFAGSYVLSLGSRRYWQSCARSLPCSCLVW